MIPENEIYNKKDKKQKKNRGRRNGNKIVASYKLIIQAQNGIEGRRR